MAVVALQALLVGSGFAAMNSGGAEGERVEAVVQESALERHEERAEQFMWAAGATLVVAGLALNVGHAGGQLVYVHGAASAYTRAATVAGPAAPAGAAVRGGDDDDDRR